MKNKIGFIASVLTFLMLMAFVSCEGAFSDPGRDDGRGGGGRGGGGGGGIRGMRSGPPSSSVLSAYGLDSSILNAINARSMAAPKAVDLSSGGSQYQGWVEIKAAPAKILVLYWANGSESEYNAKARAIRNLPTHYSYGFSSGDLGITPGDDVLVTGGMYDGPGYADIWAIVYGKSSTNFMGGGAIPQGWMSVFHMTVSL